MPFSRATGTNSQSNMADEKTEKETSREIPGIGDLQAFSQQALRYLVGATQKANALPAPGEDHDFYYSFSDFREFRKAQGTRLLNKTSDLLRHFHVRCGWPKKEKSCDSIDNDDLFENLVEANDIILEEVDTKLDEASGLSKNKKPVMSQSIKPGKPVVSSWNRRSHDGMNDNPVRLLLAKNILRSQIKFKDKIDNSNSPFVPIIKHKPNAIKELQIYAPSSPQPEDLDVPTALADFIHQQRLISDKSTKRENLSFSMSDVAFYAAGILSVVKQHFTKALRDYTKDVCLGGHGICHPYEHELQVFEPPECQLKEAKEELYRSLEETPYTFIETVEQLEELSQRLSNVTEFAIDLELPPKTQSIMGNVKVVNGTWCDVTGDVTSQHFVWLDTQCNFFVASNVAGNITSCVQVLRHQGCSQKLRSFQGFVCLMQISTRDHDYLIDTLELRSDMGILNESFTNPRILKILHGADMDIGWLQRDFGLYVVNMFDTGQASRVLNYERFSLSYLLKKFCGVTANKQYQLADWRIRPLPAEMVQYAIEDTHYLLYMYDRLRNELIKSGNAQNNLLLSVYQRSKAVCLKQYEKPLFTKESYLNLYKKQRRPLNPQQLRVFQALYEWRDTIARQEDESCGYVLPNHMLFNLSETLPREPQGVLACCNPVPTLVKQYVNEVHQIIQDAKERSVTATEVNTSNVPREDTPMDTSSRSPMIAKLDSKETRTRRRESISQNVNQVTTPSVSVKFYVPTGPQVKSMKPVISIFDYPQDDGSQELKEGQRKAKEIKAGFKNPFKVVLPVSEAEVVNNNNRTEQSQARVDKINQNWKAASTDVIEKTSKATTTNNVDNNSDEDDSTPLRQKIQGNKKRKRKKKIGAQQEDASSTPTDKKIKTDIAAADDDGHNPSYETVTKASKEFVPFDYNPAEYSKLEGNQDQSKPDIFNPCDPSKRQKKVNCPRSKVHMKAGERTMTYSKNRETKTKHQWPSR